MRSTTVGQAIVGFIVLGCICAQVDGQELSFDSGFDPYSEATAKSEGWSLQILPDGLIYPPYLAGQKEPRSSIQYYYEKDNGWSWFSTVGGQLGILRCGTKDPYFPTGVQLGIEGAAQFSGANSDLFHLFSTDARFGVPLSIGWGNQETKLAVYFLHTHPNLGYFSDELSLKDKFFQRRAIVLGHAIHPTETVRLYGEVGYALASTMNGKWEFQLGAEFAPQLPTRIWGAPFAAANLHLLETDNFGGTLALQAGWSWRSDDARLLRLGVFYLNGRGNNYANLDLSEQQIGFGVWHDY
ncbi:MAG: DUF1207 domain-containing protein [Planctomycetaceae bacterium]|nr:DUF1207 domain-containing protein [Planctomycetaceae bacterium]